jgi:hypothetical protein
VYYVGMCLISGNKAQSFVIDNPFVIDELIYGG